MNEEFCQDCGNTRTCQHCRGGGEDPDGPPAAVCPMCGGSGICPFCRSDPPLEVVSFFDQARRWRPCTFLAFLRATGGRDQAALLAALEAGETISSTLETLIFRKRQADG